jgi:hypothetical protein
VASLLSASVARAQNPARATSDQNHSTTEANGGAQPETISERTLKGHTFLFPAFVDSAFVATYVGLTLRANTFKAPTVPTDFGPTDLKMTGLRETLDLSFKTTDWLSIQATAGGRALIGTSTESLVYIGTSYGYGGGLGATIRLIRLDESGFEVSLRVLGTYTHGQTASLRSLFTSATSAIALQTLVTTDLRDLALVPLHGFTYGGALAVAKTLSPMFGLQVTGGIGGSSITLRPFDSAARAHVDQVTNGFNFRAGVAFDADFEPMHVPIAALVEYLMSREATASDLIGATSLDVLHTVGLGVFYSGRPNLQAGGLVAWQLGVEPIGTPVGTSGRPDSKIAQLILRYVW